MRHWLFFICLFFFSPFSVSANDIESLETRSKAVVQALIGSDLDHSTRIQIADEISDIRQEFRKLFQEIPEEVPNSWKVIAFLDSKRSDILSGFYKIPSAYRDGESAVTILGENLSRLYAQEEVLHHTNMLEVMRAQYQAAQKGLRSGTSRLNSSVSVTEALEHMRNHYNALLAIPEEFLGPKDGTPAIMERARAFLIEKRMINIVAEEAFNPNAVNIVGATPKAIQDQLGREHKAMVQEMEHAKLLVNDSAPSTAKFISKETSALSRFLRETPIGKMVR